MWAVNKNLADQVCCILRKIESDRNQGQFNTVRLPWRSIPIRIMEKMPNISATCGKTQVKYGTYLGTKNVFLFK
jgi:hypothetical protein